MNQLLLCDSLRSSLEPEKARSLCCFTPCAVHSSLRSSLTNRTHLDMTIVTREHKRALLNVSKLLVDVEVLVREQGALHQVQPVVRAREVEGVTSQALLLLLDPVLLPDQERRLRGA